MTTDTQMRADFEKAMEAKGFDVSRDSWYPDKYKDSATTCAYLGWQAALQINAAAQEPRRHNKPIEDLLLQYTEEACDFTDLPWVIRASRRYVKTMPDSQVRCFLHVLAEALDQMDKWIKP